MTETTTNELKALLAELVQVSIEVARIPDTVHRGVLGLPVTATDFVCPCYDSFMKHDDEPQLREAIRKVHGLLIIALWYQSTPLRDDIERLVASGWQFHPQQNEAERVNQPQLSVSEGIR